jgi:C-terminal processing protease CtpA/Prc
MKSLLAACLLVFLPALASAQTDANAKPPPFQPIVAKDHEGDGRVGVRITYDKDTGLPVIAALTRSGPAECAGFRVGDVIIKIDKNYTNTLTADEISIALHGQPGSGVELTVQRDDNPRYFVRAIERKVIRPDQEDMTMPPMSGVARP